jgi:hypothetical protein
MWPIGVRFMSSSALCADSGRTLGALGQEGLLGDRQIGQREQHMELRPVLGQAPVANLAMTKEVLHHMAGVFDTGTHPRLEGLGALGELLERTLGHGNYSGASRGMGGGRGRSGPKT